MAISFVAAGTAGAAASGNITVTPPATQTDDLMVCAVTTFDNVLCSFPAGWSAIQFQQTNGLTQSMCMYWKRAVGAEAAFVVTHALGDSIVGNVGVFRGCRTAAEPGGVFENSASQANAANSVCTCGESLNTPSFFGEMLIFTVHDGDDGVASGYSSASLGAMTQAFTSATTLGLDTSVSMAYILNTTKGNSGQCTANLTLGPDINIGTQVWLVPPESTQVRPLGLLGAGL